MTKMQVVFVVLIVIGLVAVQPSVPAQEVRSSDLHSSSPAKLRASSSALPPIPAGKSTIFGGRIRLIDPVRDQFELQIHGQRPMKILYDDRTRVYRDGARFSILNFHSADYASVETVLDGEDIFAISIHILSHLPQGYCDGRVLSYNPQTRELLVSSIESPQPVKLLVPADTPIARTGQSSFASGASGNADLTAGAMISATFDASPDGTAKATRINVLAVPGSVFVFSGKITSLDMHLGMLVLSDPQNDKRYEIHFSRSVLPSGSGLRIGSDVTVRARYDGTHYSATDMSLN